MSTKNTHNKEIDHSVRIHPSAMIEDQVLIGPNSQIWDNVHIRKNTSLGAHTSVGEKTYIAYDVKIGNFVKINAMVYICTKVIIEDGCMISAGVVFTNDIFPRAMNKEMTALEVSEPTDETLETVVRKGATIGANATIGPGIEIGSFAMIGMGSVVTKSIPSYGLAFGNPAKLMAHVCACGPKIIDIAKSPKPGSKCHCKRCGREYLWKNNSLTLI